MAVDVQTLRKGNVYEEDNNLLKVLEFQHIKVARGGATIRLKVRNLRTGATFEKTYNNNTKMQDVRLESEEMEYIYKEGDLYYFMNSETYEQFGLPEEALEGVTDFLIDNQVVTIERYEQEPISVTLPNSVELEVVWAEAAVAGDTANTPTKEVELQTGYRLKVPMYVKVGDIVKVDTREGGKFLSRVQK